MKKFTNMKQPE